MSGDNKILCIDEKFEESKKKKEIEIKFNS